MEGKILTLEEALQDISEAKCFSWSVLGNPIECEIPKNFARKSMEISVLWGVSSKYYVIANLVDATLDELDTSYFELGDFNEVEELKERYSDLLKSRGILYTM